MQGKLDALHDTGGVIGTSVSALFLLIIGVANFVILKSIWLTFARARRGETIVDEDLDALLAGRGFSPASFVRCSASSRAHGTCTRSASCSASASTPPRRSACSGISAAQAAQGMSFWTILVFPALFTAGMSLMDATDSILMTGAYGWAFVNPMRKLWYNLTITAASVIVAIFIGGIEPWG